jgi:MoaA/NifB/PqqE/SkfB family radical SAM enzyme
MEFMDAGLLGAAAGDSVPPFDLLRKAPKVRVTSDLELAADDAGQRAFDAAIKDGWAVVPIAKQAPARNFIGRSEFPRRVLLEMTSVCNVLCRMCPRNHLLRPAIHLDAETYCRLLDEVNAFGVEGIWTYHLGESLLHPQFRRIIRYIEKLDNIGIVWMSTNGHLLNDSNREFILDSRIDYLNYSLHAVTAETYRTVVPQGDFGVALRNFRRLAEWKAHNRRRRPFVHLQMIEQETTYWETQEFLETHYREVEVVSISMLEYVGLPGNQFGHLQRTRRSAGSCVRVQRGDCFVLSDGSVTLCDAVQNNDEVHAGLLYLGNIHGQTLHEIWNGPRRRAVLELESERRLTELAVCSQCTDYDL